MWLLVIVSILGIGFAGLLPKNLPSLLRILISLSLGLIIFTHLSLMFAFILGVSFFTFTISLIILALISFFSFYKFRLEFQFSNLSLFFILITLVITLLLSYVWFTQALSISAEGFKTGGGGMYGDSALHAAYTSRLEIGEFPIQNPLYAGKILVYPFANDLLSAALKIAGLNLNLAFSLPQILFLIGSLSLLYQIAKKITSNFGFVIALLILFLGWGIGTFFFLNHWLSSGQTFWNSLTSDYTDISEYNLHFHNILTGLILPERSFLPGLFLGLLMFLNFWEYFSNKSLRLLLTNGVILGALPLWHTHTFIFLSIASLIFAVWLMVKDFKKTFGHLILMFLTSLIVSIPFLFLFFSNHSVGNFVHITLGWQNGNENIFVFWLKNSLLIIPFAIVGFWFVRREQKIFFIPAFGIFLIANFVIFQPWDWDNIKLLSWSFLFFAILVGFILAKLAQRGLLAKLLVTFVILISITSGSLSILFQLKNRFVIYDQEDITLSDWAKGQTRINDIFIIDPIPNHPIPGLAGRLVYIGYPGHLWVHGINYQKREIENSQILAGDFSQINHLEVLISYVVISRNNFTFEVPSNTHEVFQNQKYLVLKLD